MGSSQQLAMLDITHVRVLSSRVAVQDTARDLDVVIDSQLSLSAHVTVVCRSGYYQLRQLRQAVRSLSEDASKTLVQAFVSCRLDYCNSLFFGISEGLINRLQSVQNATARTRCSDHHQCFVSYTGYQCASASTSRWLRSSTHSLSGVSPPYLADDCLLVADARKRRLRSTASRTCVVTRTYSTFGDRASGGSTLGPERHSPPQILPRPPNFVKVI